MNTRNPYQQEEVSLLNLEEDHFNDLKSKGILPRKLQETFVAFANADGGDLWVGIEDSVVEGERIDGFVKKEDANDILHTLLEESNPAVENVEVEYIDFGSKGYILHLSIPKSPKVHYTSAGDCFLRINARKTKIRGERVTQLGYAKGAFVYEKQPVDMVGIDDYESSSLLHEYMGRVNSQLEPRNSYINKGF